MADSPYRKALKPPLRIAPREQNRPALKHQAADPEDDAGDIDCQKAAAAQHRRDAKGDEPVRTDQEDLAWMDRIACSSCSDS